MAIAVRFVTSIDQRFPASLEDESEQSLEAIFAMPIYLAAVLSMVVAGWSQFSMGFDVADPLALFILSKNMGLVVLGALMVLAVASRGWFARRLFHIDLEFLVVAVGTVGLAATSLGDMWYAAQIFGRDPVQTFGHRSGASEVTVVMVVSLVSTASCLFMPIRSHLMWVLPTVGICMFSLVTLLASAPYPPNLPELLLYLCTLSGFSVFAGYRNESHIRKEWLAERQVVKQTDFSDKQRNAFSRLLNRLCDCLLHLGPNLEIMEPCPSLATTLFLANGTSLQGNSFCDYIASVVDRDRFVEAMGRGSSKENPAGVLPLHLRDAQSREVQVHVYYTSFHGQDDAPYHVIGITEAGALENNANPVEEPGVCRSGSAAIKGARSVSFESSDGTFENELSLESVSGSDLGEISVTFDDSPELRIISCTPGFTRLCGPIGDSPQLADWLVDKKRFTGFVQNLVNMFCSARGDDFGTVVLRTPNAARAGIEYVINECMVDAISCVSDDPSNDRFALRLSCYDIQQRRHRRRKKQAVHTCMSRTSLRQTRFVKL